jgi:hypothetical protein
MGWPIEDDTGDLETPNISERRIKRQLYIEFLGDFRENLVDFVKESVNQLCITEIPVHGTVKLFDGNNHGNVKIRNQGDTMCYVSTNGQGGFQLYPTEVIEFFVNNSVYVTTSGTTKIGFIRS